MAATTDDPLNRLVAFESLDLRPFDERRHRVAHVSIHWQSRVSVHHCIEPLRGTSTKHCNHSPSVLILRVN